MSVMYITAKTTDKLKFYISVCCDFKFSYVQFKFPSVTIYATILLYSGTRSVACTDFLKGRGEKEGHFSARFGSQEGSLSCFNQPMGQFSVFCQP